MALKAIFVLSACLALALGAVIEPRAKRDTAQNSSSDLSGLSSFTSSFSSGSQSTDGSDMASSVANSFTSGLGSVGERLQNAFNETYQEERNSVTDSFGSVKDQIHQNVETAGNLTKTAFDLGTVFPKFGKNLIIGSSN